MPTKRATHRSTVGKKLYAVRDKDGQFKDIQTYKAPVAKPKRRSAKEPDIILERWRVYKIQSRDPKANNTCHFVGYRPDMDEGRASSAIKKWDAAKMIGTTLTGRVYLLRGEPGGASRDADAVWRQWCSRHRVTEAVDISSRYLPKSSKKASA